MTTPQHTKRLTPRNVAVLATFFIMFALVYLVLPEFGKFDDTYSLLKTAQSGNLLTALLATTATYIFAALAYMILALHPIKYPRTLLIAVSSSFANRILPAGTGGLALNAQYLRKSCHTTAEAGVVVAVNNGLGFVANMIVLLVFVIIRPDGGLKLNIQLSFVHHVALSLGVGVAVIIIGLLIAHKYVNLAQFMKPIIKSFSYYKVRPGVLLRALLTSVVVCIMYTSVLYYVAHSLGLHLTFVQALLTMTLSTVGTVVIPTPGGIGGAEAGVVSVLVALGVGSSLALAVALLYRVFTFWIPLIAGAIAFRFSLRYLE